MNKTKIKNNKLIKMTHKWCFSIVINFRDLPSDCVPFPSECVTINSNTMQNTKITDVIHRQLPLWHQQVSVPDDDHADRKKNTRFWHQSVMCRHVLGLFLLLWAVVSTKSCISGTSEGRRCLRKWE